MGFILNHGRSNAAAEGLMTIRLAVIGDAGVGKTQLISSFISRDCNRPVPRQLPEITLPAQVNPDGVPMTIVDTSTADQATLERCVDEADAIVVVFAIDSAASLSSVEMRWLPLASKQCVPIIVLANKCDVVESSIDNLLEAMERILRSHIWVSTVLETSCVQSVNLENAFFSASRAVKFPVTPLIVAGQPAVLTPKARDALRWVFFHFATRDQASSDVTAVPGLMSDGALRELQRTCFGSTMLESELAMLKEMLRSKSPYNGEALLLQGPSGEYRLTLAGFLYTQMRYLDKPTLRYDVPWKILRKCRHLPDAAPDAQPRGFSDNLVLDEAFCQGLARTAHHRAELTPVGLAFLRRQFADSGSGLMSELRTLFSSTGGMPFGEESFFGSAEQGKQMALHEWLAQWRMLTALEPECTLEYFRLLGANHKSCTELVTLKEASDLSRTTFQVLVVGSVGCGKSCFLNTLAGRPGTHAPIGMAQRNVVRQLSLHSNSSSNLLIYREIRATELEQVASAVEQLEQSGALRQCDLMCFLYDGLSKESIAYAEQFFTEVMRLTQQLPHIFLRTKFDREHSWTDKDDTRVATLEPPRLSAAPWDMVSSLEGYYSKGREPIGQVHEHILSQAVEAQKQPAATTAIGEASITVVRELSHLKEKTSGNWRSMAVWGVVAAVVAYCAYNNNGSQQTRVGPSTGLFNSLKTSMNKHR